MGLREKETPLGQAVGFFFFLSPSKLLELSIDKLMSSLVSTVKTPQQMAPEEES